MAGRQALPQFGDIEVEDEELGLHSFIIRPVPHQPTDRVRKITNSTKEDARKAQGESERPWKYLNSCLSCMNRTQHPSKVKSFLVCRRRSITGDACTTLRDGERQAGETEGVQDVLGQHIFALGGACPYTTEPCLRARPEITQCHKPA